MEVTSQVQATVVLSLRKEFGYPLIGKMGGWQIRSGCVCVSLSEIQPRVYIGTNVYKITFTFIGICI